MHKRYLQLIPKLSLGKAATAMRKYNEENERMKRRYLRYLREAKRQDTASVDKAAAVSEGIGLRRAEQSHSFAG
jgi:hypothetical protein